MQMDSIPRIRSAIAVSDGELLVRFDNDVEKTYDCRPLFSRPQFALLRTPALFRAVQVDPGGYGVSWNDDIDLSEYELWCNGRQTSDEPAQQPA
jgi:hypothetical protein